jgi:hypothetical protein
MLIRVRILLLIKVMRIFNHLLHLSFHASIASAHCPSKLHFGPLQLLQFDVNADPDPDFTLMRTVSRTGPASQNTVMWIHADPDLQSSC